MPTIQELPTSRTISAPGYAYVPTSSYPDPSKAPLAPSTKKRAARTTTSLTGPNTPSSDSRLATQIQKHISELDKESSRDVQINLSGKGVQKARGGAGDKKMTPNVRRILTSNKTFANHLADEEAMMAGSGMGGEGGAGGSTTRPRAAAREGMRRISGMVSPPPGPSTSTSGREGKRRASAAVASSPPLSAAKVGATTEDAPMTGVSTQSDPEDDPLLKTYIPAPPSAAEMEALVNAPPLSYSQARAGPSVGKAQRYFCEICGYWGSVRCMRCGARVCGLECKVTHDGDRCLRY